MTSDAEIRKELRFGRRLYSLRTMLGMSQAELSKKSGVSVQSISHYERGRRNPKIDKVRSLAKALGVTSSYLLGNAHDNDVSDDLELVGVAGSVTTNPHDTELIEKNKQALNVINAILYKGELFYHSPEIGKTFFEILVNLAALLSNANNTFEALRYIISLEKEEPLMTEKVDVWLAKHTTMLGSDMEEFKKNIDLIKEDSLATSVEFMPSLLDEFDKLTNNDDASKGSGDNN